MSAQLSTTCKHDSGHDASLLGLPYDIRYIIYDNLFPSDRQAILHVFRDRMTVILPEDKMPTELLRTCKAVHAEAGAFLYHRYLFNIIGTKKDCLGVYEDFLNTMKMHAGSNVWVKALTNGAHSSIMGISLGVGEAKMALLKRRRRGEPVEIEDMKREVGIKTATSQRLPIWLSMSLLVATSVAMLAILMALLMYGRP